MPRQRISTTVDAGLLAACRDRARGLTDAQLIDAALGALLRARRRAEIDEAYAAYDDYPLDTPDEWGDMASFLRSVSAGKQGARGARPR